MRDSDRKLLGGMAGLVATFAAVNGLGYLIAGDRPGYNNAQGAASFYFLVSILVSPLGMILGAHRMGGRK